MRQTRCDMCDKTDSASSPLGWIHIGVVTDMPKATSALLAAMGATSERELKTYIVCSAICLAAFAELEAVKPEQ